MTDTATPLPRYRGLCGAIVTIAPYSRPTPHGEYRGHVWECECGVSGTEADRSPLHWPDTLTRAREAANEHASACRALPPTATK